MNPPKNLLDKQLLSLQQKQFTGRIDVQSCATRKEWRLYLCLGRLVWEEGGWYPHRSWQRHLNKYCPGINENDLAIRNAHRFECQNYHILTVLLERQAIERNKVIALINSKVSEALFDIVQQETKEVLEYTPNPASATFLWQSGLKVSLTLIKVEQILAQTKNAWLAWSKQGLDNWSPNLAPILKNSQGLQEDVTEQTYANIVKLANGKLTLRDLAVKLNQNLLRLTCSLATYIRKEYIELVEISDLPALKVKEEYVAESEDSKTATEEESTVSTEQPLIACIDDSIQICKEMEHILTQAGYRFIAIQEDLRAVRTIMASNPDLIFLDVTMPIVNGYEMCSQLRRVSKFKHTPIVMLTGNDGLMDRVRAKVVGASDFLTKPIKAEQVLGTIEKFLFPHAANEDVDLEDSGAPISRSGRTRSLKPSELT